MKRWAQLVALDRRARAGGVRGRAGARGRAARRRARAAAREPSALPAGRPPVLDREPARHRPPDARRPRGLRGGVGACAGRRSAPSWRCSRPATPPAFVGRRAGPGRLPLPPTGGEDVSATVLYVIGMIYFYVGAIRTRGGGAQSSARSAARLSARARGARALVHSDGALGRRRACISTRAAELGLNTAGSPRIVGLHQLQAKNWWGAASAFQQALAMEHDDRNWQTGLLQALNETQQYAAGLALVEQMLQAEPNDPDPLAVSLAHGAEFGPACVGAHELGDRHAARRRLGREQAGRRRAAHGTRQPRESRGAAEERVRRGLGLSVHGPGAGLARLRERVGLLP